MLKASDKLQIRVQ